MVATGVGSHNALTVSTPDVVGFIGCSMRVWSARTYRIRDTLKMKRAYKVELDPNNKQRGYFGRCAGTARFVYNWGLAEWERRMESKESKSAYRLTQAFNAIKQDEFFFVTEVPYAITESALRNLDNAFQRYWKEKKDGIIEKRKAQLKREGKWDRRVARLFKKGRKGIQFDPGYPQFKRRGEHNSFQLRGYKTDVDRMWLGRAIGWVRLKERGYIPSGVAYKKNGGSVYCTISERAGRWFISIQVEEPDMKPLSGHGAVGVDVGIKNLAVTSDGSEFAGTKALYKYERKLARLQRELSRRELGSRNRAKTKAKISRLYRKITNVRRHAQHQASHHIIEHLQPRVIILEDLNVQGMLKNHRLAKAISDAGMSELHRQITYKADWRGVQVVRADRWYASSKTCSRCGYVVSDLTLSDRIFVCPNCGLVIDRDLNAAKSLAVLEDEPSNGRELPGELE